MSNKGHSAKPNQRKPSRKVRNKISRYIHIEIGVY